MWKKCKLSNGKFVNFTFEKFITENCIKYMPWYSKEKKFYIIVLTYKFNNYKNFFIGI